MINHKDVICFLGDSMTAGGLWNAEIYQTVGATKDIRCYNCGVSGSTAAAASEYMYGMCLNKSPDKVVIMFGINDISRGALSSNYVGDDGYDVVARAVDRYAEKMDLVVRSVIDFDAEPILCIAPPYDEYNERVEENLHCDYAMAECAEIVRDIAKKYSCKLVDFRTPMLNMIYDRMPISADRVHPTPLGYHIMAQIFLKEIGEISECDFDTPFVFEEWNGERYEIERVLARLNFIDFNMLYGKHKDLGWGIIEKTEECKSRYEQAENKESFIPMCCKNYIDNAKNREDINDKLTRLTIYPRKWRENK